MQDIQQTKQNCAEECRPGDIIVLRCAGTLLERYAPKEQLLNYAAQNQNDGSSMTRKDQAGCSSMYDDCDFLPSKLALCELHPSLRPIAPKGIQRLQLQLPATSACGTSSTSGSLHDGLRETSWPQIPNFHELRIVSAENGRELGNPSRSSSQASRPAKDNLSLFRSLQSSMVLLSALCQIMSL